MDNQLSTPLMDNGEEEGSCLPDGLRRETSAASTTSSLSSEELESKKYLVSLMLYMMCDVYHDFV